MRAAIFFYVHDKQLLAKLVAVYTVDPKSVAGRQLGHRFAFLPLYV